MFEGKDIAALALSKKGQKYVLGAVVHIANPNWSGPWDCAEFVSWAAYHAYKTVIAVRPPDVGKGESYSGWWYEDAVKQSATKDVKAAIGTVGAILIRKPGDFDIKIGHVAISLGDGSTIEAHSSKIGVAVIPGAASRKWTTGMFIPGVQYDAPDNAVVLTPPAGIIELASPYMRGPAVTQVQNALIAKGVDPGTVDGVFGPASAAAVAAFQAQAGIVVDGEVGPETRQALGI